MFPLRENWVFFHPLLTRSSRQPHSLRPRLLSPPGRAASPAGHPPGSPLMSLITRAVAERGARGEQGSGREELWGPCRQKTEMREGLGRDRGHSSPSEGLGALGQRAPGRGEPVVEERDGKARHGSGSLWKKSTSMEHKNKLCFKKQTSKHMFSPAKYKLPKLLFIISTEASFRDVFKIERVPCVQLCSSTEQETGL